MFLLNPCLALYRSPLVRCYYCRFVYKFIVLLEAELEKEECWPTSHASFANLWPQTGGFWQLPQKTIDEEKLGKILEIWPRRLLAKQMWLWNIGLHNIRKICKKRVECCHGDIIHTVPMPFLLVWCWYRQWVARSEDGLRAPCDLPNRVTHTSVNTCGQMYMKYNLLLFKQSSEILIFRCWYCDDVNLWIYCGVVEEGQLPWSHLLFKNTPHLKVCIQVKYCCLKAASS